MDKLLAEARRMKQPEEPVLVHQVRVRLRVRVRIRVRVTLTLIP